MDAVVTFRGEGASVVRESLSPEAGREIPHTSVEVSGDDREVRLAIHAESLPALRAALNSYLRWMQVAVDTREAART